MNINCFSYFYSNVQIHKFMKYYKFWRYTLHLGLLLESHYKYHSENILHPVPAEVSLILGGYKSIT